MVNKTTAQKAVVAALSGMMALAPIAPAFAALKGDGSASWGTGKAVDAGDVWDRISGDDRYETMEELFEKVYTDGENWDECDVAILVSGQNWPDALAAASLCGYYESDGIYAPIILTTGNKLSQQAEDAIKNMKVKKLYIVGGTASVSTDVESYIKNVLVSDTHRIDGVDRVATSVAIFNHMNLDKNQIGKSDRAYDIIIASGTNYADALAIGGYAASDGVPIILTDADGEITQEALNSIDQYVKEGKALILGGYASVDATVDSKLASIGWQTKRIAGANRYETNIGIIKDSYEGFKQGTVTEFGWQASNWTTGGLGTYSDGVIAVSGKNGAWADALVGAPYAAYGAHIILVDDNSLTLQFLENNLAKDYKKNEWVQILGGENSVSVAVADFLNDLDGGERV